MMSDAAPDPYALLGVTPDVSDPELRRIYRALVKRHHPDHNGGSAESAARFARIQEAYSAILRIRGGSGGVGGSTLDERISKLEDEVVAARQAAAREAAARAAAAREAAAREAAAREAAAREAASREASRRAASRRAGASRTQANAQQPPTPEELGYFSTDDSFTKIIDDAGEQLIEHLRVTGTKRQFVRRLAGLFGDDR